MADARIHITADAAQAEATMRRLGDGVTGLGNRFMDLAGLAGGLGGALSIGAFATFIKNTVDGIDALNDMADATGASIEMLSGLEDRAARTGTSMDTVGAALVKFNQMLNEAKPGSAAEQALKSIGLNAAELKKLDPAEALRQTAVALSGYADDGDKARRVQDLFGKSVREIGPLLKDLAEGGVLVAKVTKEQTAQAEAFNRQLAELKKNALDVSRSLVGSLLPAINQVFKDFRTLGEKSGLASAASDVIKLKKELDKLQARQASPYFFVGNIDAQIAETSRKLEEAKKRFRELDAKANGVAAPADGGGGGGKKRLGSGDPAELKAQRDLLLEMGGITPKFYDSWDRLGALYKSGKISLDQLVQSQRDLLAEQPAMKQQEKLTKDTIGGLVKYADAVLAEGERVDEMLRQQTEKEAEREAASELAWQQGIAQRLAGIQTANMSMEELERGHLAALQNDLQAARELGFLTEQQYNELVYQETLKHQAKLGDTAAQGALARQKIEQMTAKQKTDFVIGEGLRMTQGVATTNKELFEINKIAGIAQASIALYEGTSRTWNAYPYPWNIPMTALHVATGLAQIQAISSAQFGSSTSAPTIGGGGATPVFNAGGSASPVSPLPAPNANIEPARQQVNITIDGGNPSLYSHVVEDLAPELVRAIGNGAIDLKITYR